MGHRWLLAVVAGVGLLIASTPGQDGKPSPDERQVREATEALVRAFDQMDADTAERLTVEKYVLVTPSGGRIASRAELLTELRRRKEAKRPVGPERAWRDLTARVIGDTAVVTGYTGPKGKGGQPVVNSLVTTVWVRTGDGWRAVHDQRALARSSDEGDRWNYVFATGAGTLFNPEPNALLADSVKDVKPGKALDVGMGQGRNAVYLATKGWDVTGMDPAEVGLAIARQSALETKVRITPEIVRAS